MWSFTWAVTGVISYWLPNTLFINSSINLSNCKRQSIFLSTLDVLFICWILSTMTSTTRLNDEDFIVFCLQRISLWVRQSALTPLALSTKSVITGCQNFTSFAFQGFIFTQLTDASVWPPVLWARLRSRSYPTSPIRMFSSSTVSRTWKLSSSRPGVHTFITWASSRTTSSAHPGRSCVSSEPPAHPLRGWF